MTCLVNAARTCGLLAIAPPRKGGGTGFCLQRSSLGPLIREVEWQPNRYFYKTGPSLAMVRAPQMGCSATFVTEPTHPVDPAALILQLGLHDGVRCAVEDRLHERSGD